ncbi:MAG TPA: hypothetical protein VMR41_06240 [Patescibacteria group bacterium]|nr:hypothetical protein [Patescibacteria group bacterium]
MKKYYLILAGLITVILLLIIANITLSNSMSTGGIELSQLQLKLHDLQMQNSILEEKVLSLSSYTHIASQAATLGFTPEKTQLSLSTPLPLAYNP